MKNVLFAIVFIVIFLINAPIISAQIGINSDGSAPDGSAMLDVSSTTSGFLTPRMTETEKDAISTPATGLMIYQTDGTSGFYYNEGTDIAPSWVRLGNASNYEDDPRTPMDSVAYNDSYGSFYATYLITEPGSYYFTGNINSSQSGAIGIFVDTSNVTIDLNGYSLVGDHGITSSSTTTALSSPGSSGVGIYINDYRTNITIKDGFIDNWMEQGINATNISNSIVDNVGFRYNGKEGMLVGDQILVQHCRSFYNAYEGFSLGNSCNMIRSTSRANGLSGFLGGNGCQVVNCTAFDNYGDGITLSNGTLALGCSVSDNHGYGINISDGSSAIKCVAYYNVQSGIYASTEFHIAYCNSSYNNGSGVEVTGEKGTIIRGVWHENDINGIFCSNTTSNHIKIEENRITDNDGIGMETMGEGGLIIKNSCSGNIVSYSLHANANHGPIVDVSSEGDLSTSGVSNADHPYANFIY